jgi:Tfp pilus assembly protein PilO
MKLQLNSENKRIFSVLFYPVIVVIVFCIVYFGTKQTYENIQAVKEARAQEETKLTALTKKEKILLSQNSQALQENFAILKNAVPETISLPVILATLQSLAKDTSVTVGNFALSSTQATIAIIPLAGGDRLTSFSFTVSLDGEFDNVNQFLTKLSTAMPLMSVDKVSFSQSTAKVTLQYYFQPKNQIAKTQTSQTSGPSAIQSPANQQTTQDQTKSQNAQGDTIQALPVMGAKEQAVLEQAKSLNPPVLIEESIPLASSSGRENPF